MSVYGKRRRLASAFDILKVKRQNHYVVSHHRWCQFMKKVLPHKSMAQIELLMRVLDRDGHNCISELVLRSLYSDCSFTNNKRNQPKNGL